MKFTGYVRKDWKAFCRWAVVDKLLSKHQRHNFFLLLPTIFKFNSRYIDKRSRHDKVKIEIIIKETKL